MDLVQRIYSLYKVYFYEENLVKECVSKQKSAFGRNIEVPVYKEKFKHAITCYWRCLKIGVSGTKGLFWLWKIMKYIIIMCR